MITFDDIEENLRFIILETIKQVEATHALCKVPELSMFEKTYARDDYIDNLKNIVENKCYNRIHLNKNLAREEFNEIRAVNIICVNLERIADYCINIMRQLGYLEDHSFFQKFNYSDSFEEILESLNTIFDVLQKKDLNGALEICKVEPELDAAYKIIFDIIMKGLSSGQNIQNLITTLFIFRYIERIGDAILNIGEALIFAIIGEKVKIHQFQSLQQSLQMTGFDGTIDDIDFQSYWGTRSGCRISRVEQKKHREGLDPVSMESIFKEGNLKKIEAEKKSLERWAELFPNLAPQVLSYNVNPEEDNASMLVQFLYGCTFDEMILNADSNTFGNAFLQMTHTVENIWEKTRTIGAEKIDFMSQLLRRLEQIRAIHPDFCRFEQYVGDSMIRSSESLIQECITLQSELTAPFSVLIHGDFNLTNIIYNEQARRIHFIDLHRSRQTDYIQDISVFLISNFRIPVFDEPLRERLNWHIESFYKFAFRKARFWEDNTFQARLAFALARSFYTSTRFELNFEFAKEMFLRSHYLLEKIRFHSSQNKSWEEFQLPTDILFY